MTGNAGAGTRTVVCRRDDMESGQARQFVVGDRKVAVVRIGDDFYAIGDTCSHANYSLAEGEVEIESRTLMCWKHGSEFSLETGEAMNLPATRPVPVYSVELDGDDVVVVGT